jgi:hypothetical protein
MRPLFTKEEMAKLKPKGLERHKVKWQTKFSYRLGKVNEKPEIEFSWSDRWNQVQMWLEGFAIDVGSGIIKNIIPGYFWLGLLVVIAVVLIIVF